MLFLSFFSLHTVTPWLARAHIILHYLRLFHKKNKNNKLSGAKRKCFVKSISLVFFLSAGYFIWCACANSNDETFSRKIWIIRNAKCVCHKTRLRSQIPPFNSHLARFAYEIHSVACTREDHSKFIKLKPESYELIKRAGMPKTTIQFYWNYYKYCVCVL